MFYQALSFKTLLFLFFRLILKYFRNSKSLQRSFSNSSASHSKYQRFSSLAQRSDISDHTLMIFSVEGALLKSSSLFPYFMLVAFEAGSILRAFVLFLLYPFVCMAGHEMGLKMMIMVCFFGIKKGSLRVGRAVLPKFFLEEVGLEVFEVLRMRSGGGKRVGVSDMPQVMVESFLRDYLETECVIGRELKEFCGYFVGLLEDRKQNVMDEILEVGKNSNNIIGITTTFNKSLDHHHLLSHYCKEIYLVSEGERRNWQSLPRERYPNPLIFHDGRLAFRPTPLATLSIFMWLPFGLTLALFRIIIGLSLPYDLLIPILAFTGLRLQVTNQPPITKSKTDQDQDQDQDQESTAKPPKKGLLYVCNHRTLLDPLYISFGLKRPFTAVTYSLSRMSEMLAPIRTVRLTRDRDQDSQMMEKLLNQGDMIVCPEGTTCREPYLLRFSPLFAELSDEIVPVALNAEVSMFYGTTASGLKCLDPFFFFINPSPSYHIQFLDKVRGVSVSHHCHDDQGEDDDDDDDDERSSFDVANHIQKGIGEALGFECTRLTRKDKYLILAGNEGIVSNSNNRSMPNSECST